MLLAPDEFERGLVRIKDLEQRTEEDVPLTDFVPL